MKNKFCLVILIVCLTAPMYYATLLLANHLLPVLDKESYDRFLLGDSQYIPLPNNLPWEISNVCLKVFEIKEKMNIVLFGASTTREGIISTLASSPAGWNLFNFAFSADTVQSNRILYNLLDAFSPHKFDFSDLVIIHICYCTFVTQPLSEDFLKSRLELCGFSVDENLKVSGAPTTLAVKWMLMNLQIKLAFSGFLPDFKTTIGVIRSAFTGKTNASEAKKNKSPKEDFAKNLVFWDNYYQNAKYPGPATKDFEDFLRELKQHTNVAIINMYVPTWHRTYSHHLEYNRWLKSSFSLFLKEQNIPLIDFSEAIPDDEYGDTAHLFFKGRKRFTALFNDALEKLISEIK